MNPDTINLRDLKKMRLERHWSQDQLAEMSGLSIRTIQRIENGENAGLESLKSLASVFEINITDSNKKEEMEQIRKDWSEIKSNDSWSIFKIMSEFVEAFDRVSKIGPCVSIFGSARTSEDNKYYLLGFLLRQIPIQLPLEDVCLPICNMQWHRPS